MAMIGMTKTTGYPQLAAMMNNALENEHAAYVQYLSHAKIVNGINAKPIINRLKGIAGDHRRHQKKTAPSHRGLSGGCSVDEDGKDV